MKIALTLSGLLGVASAFQSTPASVRSSSALSESSSSVSSTDFDRRKFLQFVPTALASTQFLGPANAYTVTGAGDGKLVDLPPEAVRSYLQYRVPLQIAADYYVFELQSILGNTDEWGDIGQLFRINNNKGQGQPSRIERDYLNPMRVLLLSMPPDYADDMRAAQFRFEAAMNRISKATSGIRRDLPVEIDSSQIQAAKQGWEDGRVALNEFFVLLNDATGLNELKSIPAAGPNQRDQYGRSYNRFNELVKKTKLCQNRGGPALSQAWGQLMVSGYMQDSCGIPDLEAYFYQ